MLWCSFRLISVLFRKRWTILYNGSQEAFGESWSNWKSAMVKWMAPPGVFGTNEIFGPYVSNSINYVAFLRLAFHKLHVLMFQVFTSRLKVYFILKMWSVRREALEGTLKIHRFVFVSWVRGNVWSVEPEKRQSDHPTPCDCLTSRCGFRKRFRLSSSK